MSLYSSSLLKPETDTLNSTRLDNLDTRSLSKQQLEIHGMIIHKDRDQANKDIQQIIAQSQNIIFQQQLDTKQKFLFLHKTYKGLKHINFYQEKMYRYMIKMNQIMLPEPLVSSRDNQKTLFLDLDETLVFSTNVKHRTKAVLDKDIHIIKCQSSSYEVKVQLRPYLKDFLSKISRYYEIFIFTASKSQYASEIVKIIDPEQKYIDGIIDRRYCLRMDNNFLVKDLRIIRNRKLKNMLLIDNNSSILGSTISNAVIIKDFEGDRTDKELLYLKDYLMKGLDQQNIRTWNQDNLCYQLFFQQFFQTFELNDQ